MGWKCGCVFIGEIENGYFSTNPEHKPERARSIFKVFSGKTVQSSSPHQFDFYPADGRVVIGAYEKGAFIADQRIIDLLELGEYKLFESLLDFYDSKDFLALALHSVVNFGAFAYCKNGEIKRSIACSADDGIIHQTGNRVPEEEKQYENSFERDGEIFFSRTFGDISEELPIDCIVEELVFDLFARPMGKNMDELDDDLLQTEIFGSDTKASVEPKKPFWKFW